MVPDEIMVHLEPGRPAIVVPVVDQPAVRQLFHHRGMRELQSSLRDSRLKIRVLTDTAESRRILKEEAGEGDLVLLVPSADVAAWVPDASKTPVIVLPAAVAAGLEERELAALAAVARAHGGILHISDITRAGLEEKILILQMA